MRGGALTTRGISYQALAIVREMLNVLAGRASYVRPHPPELANLPYERESAADKTGLTPVAVEDFTVDREGLPKFYEAKSNAPGDGTWTVRRLHSEGVLQAFQAQVEAEPTAECYLVTPNPCPLLGRVAEDARDRADRREFLANLARRRRDEFRRMCELLDIGHGQGYTLLKACHVDQVSAESLRSHVQTLLSGMLTRPEAAEDVLFSLAIEAMERGRMVDDAWLKARLARTGVYDRPTVSPQDLVAALSDASAILRTTRRQIAGVHIEQPAVQRMLDWLESEQIEQPSCGVLLDDAGTGKTVALSSLLVELEERGWAVLGIEADTLGPYNSIAELSDLLALPVSVLATVSLLAGEGHRVAVLIDQVDALSTASARDSAAITVLLDLVARLTQIPGAMAVLSCRSFDWRYDSSVRQLQDRVSKEFELTPLSETDVETILAAKGIGRSDLHPVTFDILQVPQHLDGFVRLVDVNRDADPRWSPNASQVYTLQSLYEDLWAATRRKARSSDIDADALASTVHRLADYMQNRQLLVVPEAGVAAPQNAVDWLVSEGLLLRQQRSLRFFHQTFFDFIAARAFVERGRSLTRDLLSSDQGLFHRPLVKQVLQYLRDADRGAFHREMQNMLGDEAIRRHLKNLSYQWLGQLPDVDGRDLAYFEPLLSDQDNVSRGLRYMIGNPAWFALLTQERVREWFGASTDATAHAITRYMASIITARQVDLLPVLEPYLGRGAHYNQRIAFCLHGIKGHWAAESTEFLSRLICDSNTDLRKPRGWWASALCNLAEDQPEEACRPLGDILSRLSGEAELPAVATGQGATGACDEIRNRLPQAQRFWRAAETIASEAPEALLDVILEPILAAMDASCTDASPNQFRQRWLWAQSDNPHNATGPAAKLLADTVFSLADRHWEAFAEALPRLTANDLHPVQSTIADALSRHPEHAANHAAQFLLGDARRFRLGTGDSRLWWSRRLIAECSPFWSEEQSRQVEEAVRNLWQPQPKDLSDLRWRGVERLELLMAFDRSKLSEEGLQYLEELRRKFPDFTPPQAGRFRGGVVGPPIPREALAKMDDRGWLGAMKAYEGESQPNRANRPTELAGGRHQLSQALTSRSKEEPERFYRLAMEEMDSSYHADYVGAIVRGIAEAGAPVGWLQDLVLRFQTLLEPANVRDVTHAVGQYPPEPVPEELEALLREWALDARDPSVPAGGSYEPGFQGELLTDGINTDRGSALWSLAKIYSRQEPPRRADILDMAEAVVGDPCPSVRAVCMRFLQYAIPAAPGRACEIFRSLLGTDQQALLRTRASGEFIYHAMPRCEDDFLDVLQTMIEDTESGETRQRGANLACLAAFQNPGAEGLRDECLTGDAEQRTGAAEVYSANVDHHELGEECWRRLRPLWKDDSEDVREAACGFLNRLDAGSLHAKQALIREWMASAAFPAGAESMAEKMRESPTANVQLTLDFGAKTVQQFGDAMADIRLREAVLPYHLLPALLSLYHASPEAGIRSRCMDLFEDLEEMGCSGIDEVYEHADRL